MVDRERLLYHLRATRFDALIVWATAVSAVAISVEFCILIGAVLSFLFYVPRAARLHMTELTFTPEHVIRERVSSDPSCGRLRIYDFEGELFFGSAPVFEELLEGIEQQAAAGVRVVLLRLKRVRNPDAVCLHVLDEFLRRMAEHHVVVLLCGLRSDLARALTNVGIADRLGPERLFRESPQLWTSTMEAVRQAYLLLGSDLCDHCPRQRTLPDAPDSWHYSI
jgi:SulP family sulfate permease